MAARPREQPKADEAERIARIASALYRHRPPLRDNCLERSLVMYRFLCLAGAEPQLALGVRKCGHTVDGHVWVVVDGQPLADDHGSLVDFAEMVIFGASGGIE